jgi:hypothetical protein
MPPCSPFAPMGPSCANGDPGNANPGRSTDRRESDRGAPGEARATKPRFAVNDVIAVVDTRPGCREVPYLQKDSGLA